MTPQITIVLIIFLLFIALILSGKVKIHVAAMMIPIALEITGVLDFKAAWGGMLNSSIVMMAAMFVVGAAVGKTSIVSRLSKTLIKGESSDFKIMLGISVPIILLSCVVNATAIITIMIPMIVGICAAYILARRRFRFGLKRPMTYWVLLVRVLPPVAFTIPLYTMFSKIGLLNTKIPVTLACVLINVPLIIWFLISFFQDLPEEVEESAKVDGATEWQLFRKIVLPLVAPGIAAVAMLSFMYAWNEYTYTVIFTRSPSNYTVPLALSVLNTEDNLTNFGLVAAGGVVSVIPITLFVIFAQNYLISGLSSGAVKE